MQMVSRRGVLTGLAGVATGLGLVRESRAQAAYPSRPVKVIVPFGPGGVTDTAARLWSRHVSERLGQQFVIENQGGGGSSLGIASASRAQPDGYTLLIAASAFAINPSLNKRPPYDPNDFEGIAMLGITPSVLIVNPSVGATTLPQLIKLIQDKPKEFTYANSGLGTPQHIQGEMLKYRFSLEMTAVPFPGGAQAIQSVVGGHVPVALTALTGLPQLINAGQLRALAVSGKARSPLLPSVPTFEEAGIADFELGTWTALLVRKGAPSSIVARLYEETGAFLKLPDTVDRFRNVGLEPQLLVQGQFSEQLTKEMTEWARIIKLAKIELQ